MKCDHPKQFSALQGQYCVACKLIDEERQRLIDFVIRPLVEAVINLLHNDHKITIGQYRGCGLSHAIETAHEEMRE